MKITMNIPDELYEALRTEAFKRKVSMTSIVVGVLKNTQHMKNLDEVPIVPKTVSSGRLTSKRGELDATNYTD